MLFGGFNVKFQEAVAAMPPTTQVGYVNSRSHQEADLHHRDIGADWRPALG